YDKNSPKSGPLCGMSVAWWHPGKLDLSTCTLVTITNKNDISRQSCQAKCSVRPAPPLNCPTKRNLRMSYFMGLHACTCSSPLFMVFLACEGSHSLQTRLQHEACKSNIYYAGTSTSCYEEAETGRRSPSMERSPRVGVP